MRRSVEKLLTFLVFTRFFILALPWLTITLLFPENKPLNFIRFTAISWNRWDAPHYLYLAQNWYTNIGDEANFIVFFPLYPLILKPLIFVLGNPAITAILVSTMLFLAGSFFFYKLVALDFSESIAKWAIIYMAIFPTAYFFNAPYTESLFLLLFSLSFYAARKNQWGFAGIFTGLSVITRPFGLILVPAILAEWWLGKNRSLKQLLMTILPVIITGSLYLYINRSVYNNPFAFLEILSTNWQKHMVSPIAGIMDSWRIAFSGGLNNFVLLVGWAEALTATTAWLLIPFVFKYLRIPFAIFYTLSVIAFSSTSFILSTPRYLLSIPPLFILIALGVKKDYLKNIWVFVSVALLICLSILFARGQWAF